MILTQMIYHVKYSTPKDVTDPGFDGRKIAYPLSYVSDEFIEGPEEINRTIDVRIVVPIDGSTTAVWNLSEGDLVRVLFEYARRYLKKALEGHTEFKTSTVYAPRVSIHDSSGLRPFDAKRIPNPDGHIETIEVQKRMGFGM